MQEKHAAGLSGTQGVPIYELLEYADILDIFLMTVGSICAMANGVSQPIMALLFGNVVDTFSTTDHSHMVHEVSQVCVKLSYLAIGSGTAAFLQFFCWTITGQRQAARLKTLYLKALLSQEIGFFDTEISMGQVIGMMSGDAITIQDVLCEKIGKSIQFFSTFLGGFSFAFVRGWLLALVLVSMIPSLLLVGGIMAIIVARTSTHAQHASSEARSIVEETLAAIRTVASLTAEKEIINRYAKKMERACKFSIQQGLCSGLGLGAVSFIVFSGYGLAIWYGCKLILERGYEGGQIISILTALVFGGMALGQMSPCLNAVAAAQAAASKLFDTINRKPKINADDATWMVLENIKGEIEFKDVYFRYPSRPNVEIFSGMSLKIPSGSTVALVGKSGSGKSTVINLLERFYDPNSGEILIDGINLKKLQVRWLRKKIGLVSQEPILFATTIRDNIAYGKENSTEDEIKNALEFANASDFINGLPLGLDTMVGELGTQLSGGQKQRIAIARIILKDPAIFLLDEVTSALDMKTGKATHDAILKIASDRTILIIAHNLSGVENANSIAVMHQGEIVEQGTHAELVGDPKGHYFQLLCSQSIGVAENEKRISGVTTNVVNETLVNHSRIASFPISTLEVSLSCDDSSGESTNISPGLVHQVDHKKRKLTFENQGKVPKKHLIYLIKDEIPILILGMISTIVHGIVYPIFGLLFSTAIKTFYERPIKLKKDSKFWALIYVMLGIANLVVVVAQNFTLGSATAKLTKRLCLKSFEKVVHQEISWFDVPTNSRGAVGARLSTNASTLQSLLRDDLALIVQNMATMVAGLLMAFMENSLLALILLVFSSVVALQSFLQTKSVKKLTTNAKLMHEVQSQVASDAIGNIRTVASFCAEKKVMDLYQKKCWIHLGTKSSINFGFAQFIFYTTNALCFYSGAILVQHNKATVQEVFKVYLALMISAMGIATASGIALDTNKASALANSAYEMLNRKPQIDSSSSKGSRLTILVGDIEFKNVSFTYPSRPNVQILKELCLRVPAGKTVVVVGASGSGKSTLINLVERFYDANSGCVLVDATEIQNYNLNWLRQQIGLVSQEPVLFNDTIRANIAFGKQGDVSEHEIISAAKTANAHNFIAALPNGYDTLVGNLGVQMSGGQKQRIAIARAMVKNPKILLLDEATSALDAESENAVQDTLNQVMLGKTTMVVTHKLSTIRATDIIAVLKDGMIIETGRHDELIQIRNGAYASLVAYDSNHHRNIGTQ